MAEFLVRGAEGGHGAVILRGEKVVGRLTPEGSRGFRLSTETEEWMLDPRVHGEIRPFSMRVTPSGFRGGVILTVRNHLFFHNGKAYLMTGIPEDVHPKDHVAGGRHVSRLDSFPFSTLEDVDSETWGRLRRHRGVSVGMISGTAPGEFRVSLEPELYDVAVPLSALSYLFYTTG